MAKKLCFFVVLSMSLLIVQFAHGQGESPSPSVSPGRETLADSPLPPPSSPEADSPLPQPSSPEADSLPPPEADSPQPPASSPGPESLADSPSPPPPPPPPQQPESPSALSPSPSYSGQAPVPAPDDNSDDESEPETEYFPSPTPSPAPEVGIPDDIKASEASEDELYDERGENNRMSGLKKAGIAIGAILGVGAIVIGALVYKKRRDNMIRARYTYFSQGDFL
ncbi:hypothetical protein V5N11_007825 [Cardamine amara subsp. amara]|uniref:Uncharacterized protein n=1 Tax=Cardamine amara subsp. amara TaxID=228776 RepID=A0ABD1C2Z5_CARAN